jgi:hypothetical protein
VCTIPHRTGSGAMKFGFRISEKETDPLQMTHHCLSALRNGLGVQRSVLIISVHPDSSRRQVHLFGPYERRKEEAELDRSPAKRCGGVQLG